MTYTANLSGAIATFTGDGASDTIDFTLFAFGSTNFLQHNRSTAGDPGFVSNLDLDSAAGGGQVLDALGATVNVNTGIGDDTVNLLLTEVNSTFNINGNSGHDVVNLGSANSAQGIKGIINISNSGSYSDLNVNNSADTVGRTVTFSNTSLIGIAPATINYVANDIANITINAGSGVDTFTVVNTVSNGSTGDNISTINTGGGNDIVNVQSTNSGSVLNINGNSGRDVVNLGNANSVQGINGVVNISNSGSYSDLNVNNSADTTGRTVAFNNTSITGLAPVAINYVANDIANITINAGSGNDTFTIANTVSNGSSGDNISTLNTGAGNDVVNVQATTAGSVLNINTQDGADIVNIGNAGSVQGILGAIAITTPAAHTTLNVDDSVDVTARTVTYTGTGITGLAPAAITYGANSLQAITVKGGTGADTFNVQNTVAGVVNIINTGSGTDIVNVSGTAAGSTLNIISQSTGATVNIGNAGSVQGILGVINVSNPPAFTNLNVDDSADATARTVTFTNAAITGLAPVAINYVTADVQAVTVTGGTGGDTFNINSTKAGRPSTINAGGGNDILNFALAGAGSSSTNNLNGGIGDDTVNLNIAASTTVTTTSNLDGGDGIDTFALSGGTGAVVVNVGNVANQVTGVVPATVTVKNFERFDLSGTTVGANMIGADADDVLIGGSGNDTITGNGGNDTLKGNAGNNTLVGGLGNDLYIVDSAGDILSEGVNEGIDTVQSSVNFTLSNNLENLTLTGGTLQGTGNALNNTLTGNALNNKLTGNGGNDTLVGDLGKDTLLGGLGNDLLDGGRGRDKLTGGKGKDKFLLTSALAGDRDVITDFVSKDDTILISRSGFGASLKLGKIAAKQFVLGSSAGDKDDRFIYNQHTGALFFDRDGIGGANKVQIGVLSTRPTIGAADIVIVA